MENAVATEGNTYIADTAGYYAVAPTNSFNNSTITLDKMEAGILHVTNMPLEPVVQFEDWKQHYDDTIEVLQPADGAEVSYTWYKINPGSSEIDPKVTDEEMLEREGQVVFNDGVGAIPFKPLKAGVYYFILESKLNDASILINGGNKYGVIWLVVENQEPQYPDVKGEETEEPVTPVEPNVEPQVDPDQNPDDDNSDEEIDPESIGD